jgi:hypothetical protein
MAALLLVSCAPEPAPPASPVVVEAREGGKPGAPVAVRAERVDLGEGRYELRLSATPRADVERAVLSWRLPEGVVLEEGAPAVTYGATAAGTTLTLVGRVRVAGGMAGADVVGDARVQTRAGTRNRAVTVRLGAARARETEPTKIIELPDGERVEEVRE